MGTVERTAEIGQNGISPYWDKHLRHMRQLRPPETSTGGQNKCYMGTNGRKTAAEPPYLRRNGTETAPQGQK